jgi:hypothetical protein
MVIKLEWLFEKVLKGYAGIALFPFIFVKSLERKKLINHEKIHIRQQLELLVLIFYIIYGLEWLINKIKGMSNDDAYRNISFEREAYSNDKNMNYLSNRKFWAFIKYYKNKKN